MLLGWLLGRRDSDTQVALLDRIAGTGAQAQRFGGRLRRLREAEAQLEALEALGDEDARDELQAFADEVPSSAQSVSTGLSRPNKAPALEQGQYSVQSDTGVNEVVGG